MARGNPTHPSYLTRQRIALGVSTAGNATVSGGTPVLWDIQVRTAMASARVAGTATGHQAQLLCVGTFINGTTTTTGTGTIGTVSLGTSAAYAVATSSDFQTKVLQGSTLLMKNGTDATGTYDLAAEVYISPDTGAWTGTV